MERRYGIYGMECDGFNEYEAARCRVVAETFRIKIRAEMCELS